MKRVVFCLAVVLGILFSGNVFAADFAADVVTTGQGGSMTAKVYVSGDKSRMETPGSVAISRMDKKVVWILMPDQRMYMEQPFDPSNVMSGSEKVQGELDRAPLGKETIDGKSTDKFKVTYQIEGTKNEMYQWVEGGTNLPIKSAAIDGSWSVEYKNIKTGPQPGSLFELPADYKKFSMEMPDMGSMMKDMETKGKQ